jgi:hypothetical protein
MNWTSYDLNFNILLNKRVMILIHLMEVVFYKSSWNIRKIHSFSTIQGSPSYNDSYLIYVMCVCFAYSGVQNILCYVFLPLVYSLDFTFCIATSIFSNVYLETIAFVFPFKSTLYNIVCTMKYADCGYISSIINRLHPIPV